MHIKIGLHKRSDSDLSLEPMKTYVDKMNLGTVLFKNIVSILFTI